MFALDRQDGSKPKCSFTSSLVPSYLDHAQVPSKKRPFATISSYPFAHTLGLILHNQHAEALRQTLPIGDNAHRYAKVSMKLSDILEGDFFNQYIKSGNILLLSQGRPGIDHTFTLVEGVLRLEIDKPTFERMGLQGQAMPSEGRKHVKARYGMSHLFSTGVARTADDGAAVELNLRLPSMVRGKNGFERVLWACKNVLNYSVAWLFYDLNGAMDGSGPIGAHSPIVTTVEPEITEMPGIVMPALPQDAQMEDHDDAADLLEWLSLVMMDSPRVKRDDNIDSYLSRYTVPTLDNSDASEHEAQDLVRFRWHGFLPPKFIQTIYFNATKASSSTWFTMNTATFDGKAYTILQNKQHTMTWEYTD